MKTDFIIDDILTTAEAQELLLVLGQFKDSLYKTSTSISQQAKKILPNSIYSNFKGFFVRNESINLKPQLVIKIIDDLTTQINRLPKIGLTLAFVPTRLQLEQIKQEINDGQILGQFLLDIKIDPHIIAGATIEYQGKYGDYSLANKLT